MLIIASLKLRRSRELGEIQRLSSHGSNVRSMRRHCHNVDISPRMRSGAASRSQAIRENRRRRVGHFGGQRFSIQNQPNNEYACSVCLAKTKPSALSRTRWTQRRGQRKTKPRRCSHSQRILDWHRAVQSRRPNPNRHPRRYQNRWSSRTSIHTFDPGSRRSSLAMKAADIHRSNQLVSNGAHLGLRYLVAVDDHAIGKEIFIFDVATFWIAIDVSTSNSRSTESSR